jgi:hypothetical protein
VIVVKRSPRRFQPGSAARDHDAGIRIRVTATTPAGASYLRPSPTRAPAGAPRAAFYGRTNAHGINAVHILARQYDQCRTAAVGRVMLTGFFYDLPQPIDKITELAVSGADGPPRRDGGWDDLAAALTGAERPFDLILCASLDRISRNLRDLDARCSLAHQNQVVIVSSDDLADLFPPATQPAQKLACEILIAGGGCEDAPRRRPVSPTWWPSRHGRRRSPARRRGD